MNLAIMQPYFLPYLGYFQLIHAVDKFVIYDDVSYMKSGWINRNRIKNQESPQYITVPVQNGRSGVPIREVLIAKTPNNWKVKMLRTVAQSYARAPFYDEVYPIFENMIYYKLSSIAELDTHIICQICSYLGITTEILKTSSRYENAQLTSVDRVLDICKKEGVPQYINAIGGRALYSCDVFEAAGISLKFVQPILTPYAQGRGEFVPGLSILDVLMNLGAEGAQVHLNQYKLL
jgi:hypothetical protein